MDDTPWFFTNSHLDTDYCISIKVIFCFSDEGRNGGRERDKKEEKERWELE